MLSKNKIKYLKSLQLKKYRLQERKFVLEGDKIVKDLILSNYVIETIYATKNWIDKHKILLKTLQYITIESSLKDLKAASSFTNVSEVMALVNMPNTLDQVINPNQSLHLYLEGIRDPGNLGTIIRSAAWFGLQQIICSPDCVDFFNNKVLQSTMGSYAHLEMIRANSEDLKKALPDHKFVGATLEGTKLASFEKPEAMVLIIGNEGKGISPSLLEQCDERITIPKGANSKTESLNAAVSASVLLSHLSSV